MEIAPAGSTAARFEAGQCRAGLPYALPFERYPRERRARIYYGWSAVYRSFMSRRAAPGWRARTGLKRENFRMSLRAGWGLIAALRDPTFQAGTTECSACKMQMEQGAAKPTIHPLKVLALAYGLMPDVAKQLAGQGSDVYVT